MLKQVQHDKSSQLVLANQMLNCVTLNSIVPTGDYYRGIPFLFHQHLTPIGVNFVVIIYWYIDSCEIDFCHVGTMPSHFFLSLWDKSERSGFYLFK